VLRGVRKDINRVDINRTAAERLEALSTLSGDTDLITAVVDLAHSASALAPSFLAMQITIHGGEQPITLTTAYASAGTVTARSSLTIHLAASGAPGHHHRLVLLAENPGAFTDFQHLFAGVKPADGGVVEDADGRGVRRPRRGMRRGLWSAG
jgi:hypothetical protein